MTKRHLKGEKNLLPNIAYNSSRTLRIQRPGLVNGQWHMRRCWWKDNIPACPARCSLGHGDRSRRVLPWPAEWSLVLYARCQASGGDGKLTSENAGLTLGHFTVTHAPMVRALDL